MAAVSSTVFLADNGMSMNGGLIIFQRHIARYPVSRPRLVPMDEIVAVWPPASIRRELLWAPLV